VSDKKTMPADGGGRDKGADDGVNNPGRDGSDSSGGAYENPHTGKDGEGEFGGFFGHGGQSEIAYHGGGQLGDMGEGTANATTKEGGDHQPGGDSGPKPGPTGPDEDIALEYPREIEVNGRPIEVIDTSGVAAAEAAGTTGVEGQERTEDNPGSG